MRLRDAAPEDAAAVAALEQQLFAADAWSAASVTEELTGPGRHGLVAVEEDVVVGYAVTLHGAEVVDLQRIGVDPRHRRRGTATALLDAALSRAGDTGADRMLLEVSAGNAAALAFYAAAGFVEIDRRRRYYLDGSDAVVMCRSLGRGAGGGRG